MILKINRLVLFLLLTGLGVLAQGPVISDKQWECEDEELLCPQWAEKGLCYGHVEKDGLQYSSQNLAQQILVKCRVSCRQYFEKNGPLKSAVKKFYEMFGGGNDTVKDPFGYEYQICDLSNGFYGEGRVNLLSNWADFFRLQKGLTEIVPKYTKLGFKKTKVPKALWGDVNDFYKLKMKKASVPWKREDCTPGIHKCVEAIDDGDECAEKNLEGMLKMHIDLDVGMVILKQLLKPAEEWSGIKLEPVTVYGIRRYLRGSWMSSHVDRKETHIISAIINVGQKVEQPWPLDIMDHRGTHHKILMKPGDLVWYESATVLHGRVEPLQGDYYDNIFVHFVPITWEDQVKKIREVRRENGLLFSKANQMIPSAL